MGCIWSILGCIMCLVSGCVFVWIEHGSTYRLIPGRAVGVYRGWADLGGVTPENSAQNKKNSPNPTRSQRSSIFVKRSTQVKLILDSDGQYDCNERKRAEIFVNHLAANMVLDESTNSFANRPTKHIIIAILTAKNKAANLSLDDSKRREWLFHFSLKFNIRTCLDG